MEQVYTTVLFPGGTRRDHPVWGRDSNTQTSYLSPLSVNHLQLPSFFFFPTTQSSVLSLCVPSPFLPLCLQKGPQSLTPTTQGVARKPSGDNYQLLVAVVGSVTVTCVTILLALLALFFIRKTLLNRRRTFTYQSGSVRAPSRICYPDPFIRIYER